MRTAITIQTPSTRAESLGARIVRRASEVRSTPPPKPADRPGGRQSRPGRPSRGEHEYVRERGRSLALIREHIEVRAEFARKLGRIEGDVIGFSVVRATLATPAPAPSVRVGGGGGGDWLDSVRETDRPERPTKRRGRPGRRGKLVAALARSRSG